MSAPSPVPWLKAERKGEVTVVRFTCDAILDEVMIQHIGEQLYRLAEQLEPPHVILDCSRVKIVSSSMLAKLIGMQRRTKAAKGRLALCSVHDDLLHVLKETRLTELLSIYRDEQEALQTF
jgi:anti-anti-sigma factor